MGQRGPKPKPTAILKLRGSRWAKGRENEPQSPAGDPRQPKKLSPRAKEIWAEYLPIIEGMGLATIADGVAFGQFCRVAALLEEGSDDLETVVKLQTALAKGLALFGLSPADRANMKSEKPASGPKKKDYFAS